MNDKIYFVAPSFGVTTSPYKERFRKALKNLKMLGFTAVIGENVYLAKGKASSNTPELRGKEIVDAYASDADIIWSVGGGEVMCQILEYIDFEKIKNSDKLFIGFSDNTNLAYTIPTITEKTAIYGVCAPSMSMIDYDSFDTLKMIDGEKKFKGYKEWVYEDLDETPVHPYVFDRKTKMYPYQYEGPVKGRIIGGCLDCLSGLCGTKFDNTVNYMKKHKEEGIIFFMEACDYNSVGILRALTQLKNAGWFDNVDAFLIGRSNNFDDDSFGLSVRKAYLEVLLPFGKPVILDCSIGHKGPSVPIKEGALVTVKYSRNTLTFNYE